MLVVDDSVVIRRLVTHALEEDGQLQVVGSAPNGVFALQRIPQLNPDVITLDIEMPEMDGLETLRRIRAQYPHVHVIMFSTLTSRGAVATLDALSLGADDYVTKASNAGSLDVSMTSLRAELIPKIKQFFRIATHKDPSAAAVPPRTGHSGAAGLPRQPAVARSIVAIGVSTGGPNALARILPAIPKTFPLPILIVQHMPQLFTRLLAERLNAKTELSVEEAQSGTIVSPGKIFVAKGDYHMRTRQNSDRKVMLTLDQEQPENSCRPAVDVMFRSVAEVYGRGVIAVVLTGMGQDGLYGAQILRASGAYVIAQDEPSSVVWGMPGAVAKAGLADAVVDLDRVIPEILHQVR